jgi:hypothetical protein
MPKRTGAQGYTGAAERVGEVVQLTGKLSQWRVRVDPCLPHTFAFALAFNLQISSPNRTSPAHVLLTPSYMRSLSLPL